MNQSTMAIKPDHTLQYVKPGAKGPEYIHHWPQGWQTLLFSSHDKAKAWAEQNGCKFTGPNMEQPE